VLARDVVDIVNDDDPLGSWADSTHDELFADTMIDDDRKGKSRAEVICTDEVIPNIEYVSDFYDYVDGRNLRIELEQTLEYIKVTNTASTDGMFNCLRVLTCFVAMGLMEIDDIEVRRFVDDISKVDGFCYTKILSDIAIEDMIDVFGRSPKYSDIVHLIDTSIECKYHRVVGTNLLHVCTDDSCQRASVVPSADDRVGSDRVSILNSLDDDAVVGTILRTEITRAGNEVTDLVTQPVRDLLEMRKNERLSRRKITLTSYITTDELSYLSKLLPGYAFEVKPSDERNLHGMSAAVRTGFWHHLSHSALLKDGQAAVELGGNIFRSFMNKDINHVDTCFDVSVKDSARLSVQIASIRANYYSVYKSDKDYAADYAKNTERYAHITNCIDCEFKSPYMFGVDSIHDMSISEVCMAMRSHSSIEGNFLIMADMRILSCDEVYMPNLKCYMRKKLSPIDKRLLLSFEFEDDSTLNYLHDYDKYLTLLSQSYCVLDGDSCPYVIERKDFGGPIVINIRRVFVSGTISKQIISFNWWANDNDYIVINAPIATQNVSRLYKDQFELRRIVLKNKTYNLIMGNVYGRQTVDRHDIYAYIRSGNWRRTTMGNEWGGENTMSAEDMLALSNALYIVAIKEKILGERLAARNVSILSSIANIKDASALKLAHMFLSVKNPLSHTEIATSNVSWLERTILSRIRRYIYSQYSDIHAVESFGRSSRPLLQNYLEVIEEMTLNRLDFVVGFNEAIDDIEDVIDNADVALLLRQLSILIKATNNNNSSNSTKIKTLKERLVERLREELMANPIDEHFCEVCKSAVYDVVNQCLCGSLSVIEVDNDSKAVDVIVHHAVNVDTMRSIGWTVAGFLLISLSPIRFVRKVLATTFGVYKLYKSVSVLLNTVRRASVTNASILDTVTQLFVKKTVRSKIRIGTRIDSDDRRTLTIVDYNKACDIKVISRAMIIDSTRYYVQRNDHSNLLKRGRRYCKKHIKAYADYYDWRCADGSSEQSDDVYERVMILIESLDASIYINSQTDVSDIERKRLEVLRQSLVNSKFPTCVIRVVHDRYFLNDITATHDRVVLIPFKQVLLNDILNINLDNIVGDNTLDDAIKTERSPSRVDTQSQSSELQMVGNQSEARSLTPISEICNNSEYQQRAVSEYYIYLKTSIEHKNRAMNYILDHKYNNKVSKTMQRLYSKDFEGHEQLKRHEDTQYYILPLGYEKVPVCVYALQPDRNSGDLMSLDHIRRDEHVKRIEVDGQSHLCVDLSSLTTNGKIFVSRSLDEFTSLLEFQTFEKHIDRYKPAPLTVTLHEGGPGCGKSTTIVRSAARYDLVLGNTRTTTNELKNKISKRRKVIAKSGESEQIDNKLNVRTISSFLVNYESVCKGKIFANVAIDEALMMHAGQIYFCCYLGGFKSIDVYGDRLQIPFLSRVADFDTPHQELKFDKVVPYNLSYRLRQDAIVALRSIGYDKLRSSRSGTDTLKMKVVTIASLADVPRISDTDDVSESHRYLTWTQVDKAALLSRHYKNVSTVHEFQGSEADSISLVRLQYASDRMTNGNKNQCGVAISRHRENFVYYTVKFSGVDYVNEAIKNNPAMANIAVEHDNVDNTRDDLK
jgi:hypothetical protein